MKQNKPPLVSVIMPTYNTAKYIKSAIDSVLMQTYVNFELIIVDDGSTDNTNEIVCSYSDSRIQYFKLDKNMGRGFARNFAISKCSGEYIAISDADDINSKDRLQLQIEYFQNNQHIHIVGTQLLHFTDGNIPRKVYHFPEAPNEIKKAFSKGVMGIAHASCMLKSECFKELRYEDNISYNVEDFELFLQLNNRFNMVSLSQALVLYRNDLSSISIERLKFHDLYHHYAIYSANSKSRNVEFLDFENWASSFSKTWKHRKGWIKTYVKLKIKNAIWQFTKLSR